MTSQQRPVVAEMPALLLGKEGITQKQVSALRDKITEMIRVYNGVAALVSVGLRLLSGERVEPGKKLAGLVVDHVFTEAGVATGVSHGLQRYPIGYLVLRRYPLGQVGDGSPQDWGPLTAFLQTDVAGLRCTVLFF